MTDFNAEERNRWGGPSPWAGKDSRTDAQKRNDRKALDRAAYAAYTTWAASEAPLAFGWILLSSDERAKWYRIAEAAVTAYTGEGQSQ